MTKIWLEPGSINCTCCQDIPGCRNVPKEETDPIVDAVCAKLQSRSAVGIKKYGTTLAGNNATVKEKLVHIQEELMDAANYVEWLLQDLSYGTGAAIAATRMMADENNRRRKELQEKEMPTPMTIEMEEDDIKAALDQINLYIGYTAHHVDAEQYKVTWGAFKKVKAALQSSRVITDAERQAALASLKREYELNGSNQYNWFIRDYYDILCAALQSPHPYYGPCDALANGDCAECLKQSPRVPVIDTNRLENAIWYCREDWQEKDGLQTLYDEMDIIIKYARAYAELQKGV